MLSYLFRQLISSCGVFLRTIRAFFTRRLTGLWARLRRVTNLSRQATKVAADSVQGAAAAIQKPTKREDYIETKRLFISKSFLFLFAVGLLTAAALVYFVLWPFVLSRFLTARFPVDDPRLSTWTGRVIVYADRERTLPLYAGRLEEGVLQGRGKEYGPDGLVCYEGDFAGGVRAGAGRAYEGGVLVYEGAFSAGTYSGQGKLYEGGALSYSGGFSSGVASGEGVSYYASGAVRYRGAFAEGAWDGTGTAYFENGVRSYLGTFSAGLREGEGAAFDQTGRVVYRGGFSQDRYSGEGTRYPAEGERVAATFDAGVAGGTIQWYREDALYYDGSADDLTPSGFGTIYGSSGEALYRGNMTGGTVNGAWLLGQTAEEVRAAFAEGPLVESANPAGGFTIASPQLGCAVVCSYASEEAAPTVYEVYLWRGSDQRLTLLPWSNGVPLTSWLEGEPETASAARSFPAGVPLEAGTYQLLTYPLENGACQVLSTGEAPAPSALHWSAGGGMPPETALPVSGGVGDAVAADGAEVEALLEALDQMERAVVLPGGNPYLGEGDPLPALAAMETPGEAAALADAYLDYLASAETRAALEEQRALMADLLSAAQTEADRGLGDAAALEALAGEVDRLSGEIETCAAAMKKAELLAGSVGGAPPQELALGGLTLLFDPAALDVRELPLTAVSYAQAVAEDPRSVDAPAIELSLKLSLIDLGTLYSGAEDARGAYEAAAAAARAAAGDFATGKLDRAGLYAAQRARSEAQSGLCRALCAFTRQANSLNALTGGWVSRSNGWCAGAFLPLYDAQLQAAAPAEEPTPPETGEPSVAQIQPDVPEPVPADAAPENT